MRPAKAFETCEIVSMERRRMSLIPAGRKYRGFTFASSAGRDRAQPPSNPETRIGSPSCNSRPGMTRRLFKTSSVSVRMKKVAISSIHFEGGQPHLSSPRLAERAHELALGNGFVRR